MEISLSIRKALEILMEGIKLEVLAEGEKEEGRKRWIEKGEIQDQGTFYRFCLLLVLLGTGPGPSNSVSQHLGGQS
jgi:hypothetical protein